MQHDCDIDRLRAAAEAYRRADDVARRREAICETLKALTDGVMARGATPEHVWPITELLAAIADIDEGTPNPLLTPDKRGGRKERLRKDQALDGLIAAAVTLEIRTGARKAVACRTVASRLAKMGIELRQKAHNESSPAKTIASLRDKVMNGDRGCCSSHYYQLALNELGNKLPRNAAIEVLYKAIAETTTTAAF